MSEKVGHIVITLKSEKRKRNVFRSDSVGIVQAALKGTV